MPIAILGASVDSNRVVVGDKNESRPQIPADHLAALKLESGEPPARRTAAQSDRLLVASFLLQAAFHNVFDSHFPILDEIGNIVDGKDLYALEAYDSSLRALLCMSVDRFPQLLLKRFLLRELVVVCVLQHAAGLLDWPQISLHCIIVESLM